MKVVDGKVVGQYCVEAHNKMFGRRMWGFRKAKNIIEARINAGREFGVENVVLVKPATIEDIPYPFISDD